MVRLVLLAASLVVPTLVRQTSLPASLRRSFSVLGKAKSLTIKGTIKTTKAGAAPISILLSKPDKFRVETPDAITVSDGKRFTVYRKADNAYIQTSVPEFMPDEFFGREEVVAYGAFFSKEPASMVKSAAATRGASVDGYATDGVVVTPTNGGSMSLLIDRKLSVVRRSTVLRKGEATIVEAKTIIVDDAPLPPSLFRFVPPPGAVKEKPGPLAQSI